MNIRLTSFAELEAQHNFQDLLAEYAGETMIEGLPSPEGRMARYHHLDRTGAIHVFCAFHEGVLIGFLILMVNILLHYEIPPAFSESFFVAKSGRKTGAGLKLLKAAEKKAKELGAPGVLVGTPATGVLCAVLPRLGYLETNRVFFKKVAHG